MLLIAILNHATPADMGGEVVRMWCATATLTHGAAVTCPLIGFWLSTKDAGVI